MIAWILLLSGETCKLLQGAQVARQSPRKSLYEPRRRAALRQARKVRKLDALLASRPQDVRYLTGFTGEDSFVLVGVEWACLVTDGRYGEQARGECRDIDIHIRKGRITAAVAEALKGKGVRGLGVQSDHVTVAGREALDEALSGKRIVPISSVLRRLREVKDAGEVRAIRKAIRVAQRAFRSLLADGAKGLIGKTEREVAAELDYRMRLEGADSPAFATIVAGGAHGSLPHYRPGGRRIRRDEALLLDFGASVGGYCSDLTRVVFIGRIPRKLAEIYRIVLRAQSAGIAACRAGAACRSVDEAARKVIREAGYGEQFMHGLGHGIGLEVHERPVLAGRSSRRLRAGMVVTVEPGIYLPGVGGVRIEDDVLVTREGPRRLSSLPRGMNAMRL